MAMTLGTKKWSTLATWDDQAIYEYFRQDRGQTPRHATNSVRQVRAQFSASGTKYPKPIDPPHVTVDEAAYQAKRAGNQPAVCTPPSGGATLTPNGVATIYNTPGAAAVSSEPVTFSSDPVPQEPAIVSNTVPADKPLSSLAAMLAPELIPLLKAELAAAVAGMAPVVHRIVVSEKLEVKLPKLTHRDAEEIIRLSHRKLNVLMKGPAGTGKTSIAKSVALSFDRPLTRVSFSAGMSEGALLGRPLPVGAGGSFRYIESPFVRAYRTGGIILLDEIDAADANLLLVLNTALDNGGIEIEARAINGEDTYVERHKDTVILAAANTWGTGADTQYVGRAPLDKATLDRFFPVDVDYDPELEAALGSEHAVRWVQSARKLARAAKLQQVLSTRMILKLDEACAAGMSFEDAKRKLLAPWSADERAKIAHA